MTRSDPNQWRLLRSRSVDPYRNLALEEALLTSGDDKVIQPTLRLWRNSEAVVLGVFQDPSMEANLEFCSQAGIAVIRRLSGGGSVYHDLGNLNWSIFIPKKHEIVADALGRGLPGLFDRLSSGVVEGLRILKINPKYKFPNSILVEGKKISGLAGSIKISWVLCHGTLLVSSNLQRLEMVLTPSDKTYSPSGSMKFTRSVKAKVTTLEIVIGRGIGMNTVEEAMLDGFNRVFQAEFEDGRLTDREEQNAQELYSGKYLSNEWNYKVRPHSS